MNVELNSLEAGVQDRLAAWMRAAVAFQDMRNLKIARLGDNMRQVAVTEGDGGWER